MSTSAAGAERRAEQVFLALADPTRRRILVALSRISPATSTDLARVVPVSRQAVHKHLALLAEAGLVESSKVGRDVRFRIHGEPLVDAASWLRRAADAWDDRLADLKSRAEAEPTPPAREP